MKLEDNFVPHEIGTKLKEKGFNELIFSWRDPRNQKLMLDVRVNDEEEYMKKYRDAIPAPLYQQVVDWFDKKGLTIDVTAEDEGYESDECECRMFEYYIKDWTYQKLYGNMEESLKEQFMTRQEAYNKAFEQAFKLR